MQDAMQIKLRRWEKAMETRREPPVLATVIKKRGCAFVSEAGRYLAGGGWQSWWWLAIAWRACGIGRERKEG